MKLNREQIKIAQMLYNRHFLVGSKLSEDGLMGPATRAAMRCIESVPTDWASTRQVVGCIQAGAKLNNAEPGPVDGYWGPQTQHAFGILYDYLVNGMSTVDNWRDDEAATVDTNTFNSNWPLQRESYLLKFFGQPGQNQAKVTLPFPLRIAWNLKQKVRRVTCHEMIADPFLRIMTRAKDFYGDDFADLGLDLFGGCLNVRKMRGGTKWSMHSWGIAFDFDPARNRLKWKRDRARFAKPVYSKWFDLWEEEGAISLGRERDYDWMHTQFARLR